MYKARAAILAKQHSPLVVADIEVPEPGYGQVLVEVHASGICGAQLGEIDGFRGKDPFLPHLLGHEGGGVVLDIGEGVTRVKPGDRVVMHWLKAGGIDAETADYRWEGRHLNAGWVTTFNEKAVVSENRLTPVDGDVPFEVAALMGCVVTTGMGAVENDAAVTEGGEVLIFGTGGIGLVEVMSARNVGAAKIVAVDLSEFRLEAAKKFGATHTVNAGKKNFREDLLNIFGEEGSEAVIENTGKPEVIETAMSFTAAPGIIVMAGVPPVGSKITVDAYPFHRHRKVTGSMGGGCDPERDIPRYIDMYRDGQLPLDEIMYPVKTLDEINDCIAMMRRGETLRCMLRMNRTKGGE